MIPLGCAGRDEHELYFIEQNKYHVYVHTTFTGQDTRQSVKPCDVKSAVT